MNGLMLSGVLLNLFISLLAWPEMGELAFPFFAVGLVGALGLLFVLAGKRVVGARIVFFSSFVFIPIGLLALLGARKCLDQVELENFHSKAPTR